MPAGKSILITGASSGIGLALARLYLTQGDRVLALARNLTPLAALQQQFPSSLICFSVDLSRPDQLSEFVQSLGQKQQHLDLIILNAGICEYLDVSAWDPTIFERVMRLNFNSNVALVPLLLPFLRASSAKDKCLVAVSSMVVRLPLPRAQAYGASKAALEYFMTSLAVDLQGEGIAVSLVRPGFVKTPLTDKNDFPMPFLIDPERAALRIIRGINRKKVLIEFPLSLVWLMRLVSWMPAPIRLALLSKLSRNN